MGSGTDWGAVPWRIAGYLCSAACARGLRLLVTVLCRAFSKSAFSRQSVTCKECARFSAEVVQNLPGFDGPGMRPRRYGHYWGH
ncbi:MAG: hypothetical protein BWY92_01559 [Firmicutes bacterium ADurb.BinA052]|nr:MAG: hypothetical protein BWY92_01559 [Firmicutes bacterium ADurb.BinA052]